MPRPRKCRRVFCHPKVTFYKPQGIPMRMLRVVTLPVEGLEALRLADLEGLNQEDAARSMGISKPTFCRILANARHMVAKALSNGYALSIEGGTYHIVQNEAPAHGARGYSRCPKLKDTPTRKEE